MTSLVLGIAGGTGSGKTTIATAIAEALPPGSVTRLEHDSYYRDLGHLDPDARSQTNFDHPDSLETELLVEHVRAIKAGAPIDVPIYDFTRHTRKTAVQRYKPTPLVIVEGILTFVDASLRELLDIKIFVDTDADIRIMRRIRRDMEQRGRDFASIRDQYYATVRPMHQMFVEPSKRWADLIVPEGGDNRVALDLIVAKLTGVVAAHGPLLSGEGAPVLD
jgi:uridine kinase